MIPKNKVRDLISRHSLLEKELSSGEIDKKNFADKSKEYADLNELIKEVKEYSSYEQDKKDIEKILNDKDSDKEMQELANKELDELIKKNQENEKKIKLFLLPKDEADKKNAIIEIRAGTGGLEAVFLLQIYLRCMASHKKKWILELISISKVKPEVLKKSLHPKRKKYIFNIKIRKWGTQSSRVPDTETQGRVHTSVLLWLFFRGGRSRC